MKKIIVPEEIEESRLDKFLMEQLDASRSQIQKDIKEGRIKVNGTTVKPNYQIKEGDVLELEEAVEELTIEPEKMPLDIVYEDDDLLVVNKPAGMVVHPAPGNPKHTLVNGLLYHASLSGMDQMRPGIVHRIDKDTSGLLVVAKNDKAHQNLADQLKNKTTVRKYIALVEGVIPHKTGTIDAPIGRDPNDRKKMTVTENNAKAAVTHFTVLKRFQDKTLLECVLETGRTHQIRVHMNYIGYPIVNDPVYGKRKVINDSGQMLHAKTLGFEHPTTGKYMEFDSELPEKMTNIINTLE